MTESSKARAATKIVAPAEPELLIGKRIRAARTHASMSMSDLHRATGISRAVLRNYEVGRYKPGARELRRLCDALRVSPNELIYGAADPFRPPDPFALVEGQELDEEAVRQIFPSLMRTLLLAFVLPRNDREALLRIVESLCSQGRGPEYLGQLNAAAEAVSAALLSQLQNLGHVAALASLHPAIQTIAGPGKISPPAQEPKSVGSRKRTPRRRTRKAR